MVRQQTANGLRLHSILVRHTGVRLSATRLHAFTKAERQGMLPEADQILAVTSSLAVLDCLRHQLHTLERAVRQRLKHSSAYEQRLTVDGLGAMVAQTIVLETGHLGRFSTVGHSASSCRCVKRTNISHGKRQGQGNVNHGTPSLAWTYREAAQVALRFSPRGQRFYPRQQAQSHLMVARKAVAHTLARAC